MSLLLSHNSALERLRSVPPQVDLYDTIKESVPLARLTASGEAFDELALRGLGLQQRPVHKLVPNDMHTHPSNRCRPHRSTLSELPPFAVRKIGQDAYTVSPEVTFVQMAGILSPLGLVVLGHELCGTYSHFSKLISGFYERPPLTSTEKIAWMVDALGGVKGVDAARSALKYIRDGCATPTETVVSCMLTLPSNMGGFGLVSPAYNHEVTLDEAGQELLGTPTCRVMTAYPSACKGIEFTGELHSQAGEETERRLDALANMDWYVQTFDLDELITVERLRELVSFMDGVPHHKASYEPDDEAANALLERLFKATRHGLGLNAALFGVSVPEGSVRICL